MKLTQEECHHVLNQIKLIKEVKNKEWAISILCLKNRTFFNKNWSEKITGVIE